jgi:ferritin
LIAGDITSKLTNHYLQYLLYAIAYIISLSFLEKTIKSHDFYQENSITNTPPDEILIAGEEIKTDIEEDNQESRFYRIANFKKNLNRKLFALIFNSIFVFISFKIDPQNFKILAFLPFISTTLIMFSATSGHLLIPLFFNEIYVALNCEESNSLFIISYIAIFMSTLVVYSQISLNSNKVILKNSDLIIRNTISALIPFCICLFLFSTIIDKKKLISFDGIYKINHKLGKLLNNDNPNLNRSISLPGNKKTNNKNSQTNFPLTQLSSEQINLKFDEIDEILKSISKDPQNRQKNINQISNELNSLNDNLNINSDSKVQNQAEINILKNQIKKSKEILDRIKSSPEPSFGDVENLKNSLNNLEDTLTNDKISTIPKRSVTTKQIQEKLDELQDNLLSDNQTPENQLKRNEQIEKIQNDLNSIYDQRKNNPSALLTEEAKSENIKNNINNSKEILDRIKTSQKPNSEDIIDLKNKIQNIENNLKPDNAATNNEKQISSNPSNENRNIHNPKLINENIKEDPNKEKTEKIEKPFISEALLTQLLKLFKSILILSAVFVILIFLNKILKKANQKELKQFKPEDDQQINMTKEIVQLKKLKLTPKEEIMLYYELFYKMIKSIHYPDVEAPPPTELFNQVSNKYQKIEMHLKNITEIFSSSFYGNHPISEKDLKQFRQSITQVFAKLK